MYTVRRISYLYIYFAHFVGLSHTALVSQSHGQIRKTVHDQCSQYRDLRSEACIVLCVRLPLYHEPSTSYFINAISYLVSKACYSQYKAYMRNGWSFSSAILYAFYSWYLDVGFSLFFFYIEDRSFVRPVATKRGRAEIGYALPSDRLIGNYWGVEYMEASSMT